MTMITAIVYSCKHLRCIISFNSHNKLKSKLYILHLTHCLRKSRAAVCLKAQFVGFPGGAVVKNRPANAGDTGSSPGLGRSHMLRSN